MSRLLENSVKRVLVGLGLITLTACNSESLETANFGSDLMKSTYEFINLSDNDIHFHMRNSEIDGDARVADATQYRKAIVRPGQQSNRIQHELNAGRYLTIYAVAPDLMDADDDIHVKHDIDDDYNVIAWQRGGAIKVLSAKKESSDKDNIIRVRFFAVSDMSIKVKGNDIFLREGQLTPYYDIANCNDDIEMEDASVHVCDGSFGRSYILALNSSDKIGLYQQ